MTDLFILIETKYRNPNWIQILIIRMVKVTYARRMNPKLESRLRGEISTTSNMQNIPC